MFEFHRRSKHAQLASLTLIYGCLLLTPLTSVLHAADWPQWRGPSGTGHAPDSNPELKSLPNTPSYVWKFKIGDGLASPIIQSNRVFYFDHQQGKEVLHAIDKTSAKELWQQAIDDTFKDSQYAPGPRCTPMVDGDRAYAQSCRGTLKCLNVSDGSVLWSIDYSKDFGSMFIGEKGNSMGATRHGFNGMAVIDGDRLFALPGGTNGAGVVCLDKRTGKTLWKSLSESPGYAPPTIATLAGRRQVLAYMVSGLVSVDAQNGEELWRVPIKTAYARHVTTPVTLGDLAIVSSHQAGTFATRALPKGAEPAWSSKDASMNVSSPVLVGSHLYGLGPTRNIFCQDASTGKINWSQEGLIHSSADKAQAGFIAIHNHILALTDTGSLILFESNSTKYVEKGQLQVAMNNWCNPALADGILYLRDARELMAVKLME